MRLIELTPRLAAVAHQISMGANCVDVGTDHGRLPVWLLEHGVTDHIIATDLRRAPLDRARQTAARHGMTEKISFRLGNGLDPVTSEETDTVVITGMGGETIAAILQAAPWTALGNQRFLLQPMTSAPDLRRWLWRHGFRLEQEVISQEGENLYTIMTAAPGEQLPLTPAEEWAGRQWAGLDSPLRAEYLSRITARTAKALDGLRRSTRVEDEQKRTELTTLYDALTAMEQEWAGWQR